MKFHIEYAKGPVQSIQKVLRLIDLMLRVNTTADSKSIYLFGKYCLDSISIKCEAVSSLGNGARVGKLLIKWNAAKFRFVHGSCRRY